MFVRVAMFVRVIVGTGLSMGVALVNGKLDALNFAAGFPLEVHVEVSQVQF
jgi:hypothetical protein